MKSREFSPNLGRPESRSSMEIRRGERERGEQVRRSCQPSGSRWAGLSFLPCCHCRRRCGQATLSSADSGSTAAALAQMVHPSLSLSIAFSLSQLRTTCGFSSTCARSPTPAGLWRRRPSSQIRGQTLSLLCTLARRPSPSRSLSLLALRPMFNVIGRLRSPDLRQVGGASTSQPSSAQLGSAWLSQARLP